MNKNPICFFDFETGSKYPDTAQPTQIAAVMIDGRRLEILDKFSSYILPIEDKDKLSELGLDSIGQEALEKTKITWEQLRSAPPLKIVWENFCSWVSKYNYKKNKWSAPIAVGYNSNNFDDVIINRICCKPPYNFGPKDDEYNRQGLFHPIYNLDLMKIVWIWMENKAEINSISFDSMREYLGLASEHGHNAEYDVQQGAEVLIRFLKLHRNYSPKVKFKGAMGNGKV